MKNKLVQKYIDDYCFLDSDKRIILDKRNKYLLIMLPVFLAINVVFLTIGFATGNFTMSNFFYWNYYHVQVIVALGNLIFCLICNRFKNNNFIRGLPVFVFNISYLALNLWDYYVGGYFHTAFCSFSIHGIVCCILLELDPLVYTFSLIGYIVFFILKTAGVWEVGPVSTNRLMEQTLVEGPAYLKIFNISLFAIGIIILLWWRRYTRVQNFKYIHDIDNQKKQNEQLILNILPRKIADDLKVSGKTSPERFESVSVLFTDFQNFTSTTEHMSPEVTIAELNDIFTAFDTIAELYGCTRIKTIGDSYLAVCGLPDKSEDHAERIVYCAKEFVEYLENRNKTSKIKWYMRLGINSGPLMAGVVGTKKYLYDIFGDTVNTASRMESNSEPMKINISAATRKLLGKKFKVTKRPAQEVKGKGKMVMYFVK